MLSSNEQINGGDFSDLLRLPFVSTLSEIGIYNAVFAPSRFEFTHASHRI